MKYLILTLFVLVQFYSPTTWSALPPAPTEQRNPYNQNEVMPPMGILNCPECLKGFKGGASAADRVLIREHVVEIFGSDVDAVGSKALEEK